MDHIAQNKIGFFRSRKKAVISFYFIFYLIGIAGFMYKDLFQLFIKLTPYALMFSFLGLMLFHEEKFSQKTGIVFFSIYLITLIIEAIGVKTGYIFGNYRYGDGLGIKIADTPIIIGLNWLLLIYTSSSVLTRFKFNIFIHALLASFIMIIYDLILEQVAPEIDMWQFDNNRVPIQNFISWFIIAFVLHLAIKWFKINTENKLSFTILLCQFLFFIFLLIF